MSQNAAINTFLQQNFSASFQHNRMNTRKNEQKNREILEPTLMTFFTFDYYCPRRDENICIY